MTQALTRRQQAILKYLRESQLRQTHPPTLDELSEQFGFKVPGEADVMLRIMESDPRMPPFLERDPDSGEIVRVDTDAMTERQILRYPTDDRLILGTTAIEVADELWVGQVAGGRHRPGQLGDQGAHPVLTAGVVLGHRPEVLEGGQ